MRYILSVLGFALAFGCTTTTAPDRDRVRRLAEIAGFHGDDPRVAIVAMGRSVNVSITSYGGGCHTKGETDVVVNGLEADVTPYDYYTPPQPEEACIGLLRVFVHQASLSFERSGTAQIRIRGIDAASRSGTNLVGDTLVVVRTVELP